MKIEEEVNKLINDEVIISDIVFSADEIKAIYNLLILKWRK